MPPRTTRAEFLAPLMGMCPLSGCPPQISITDSEGLASVAGRCADSVMGLRGVITGVAAMDSYRSDVDRRGSQIRFVTAD